MISKLIRFTLFLLLFSVILSCKDKYNDLGADFIPLTDSLKFQTENSIQSYIITADKQESVIVDTGLLGCYQDSIFGLTKAEFASGFFPESYNVNFHNVYKKTNSCYLQLKIIDNYGMNTGTQKFEIYALKSSIAGLRYSNSNYQEYFNSTLLNKNAILYTYHSDSGLIIRIPINESFVADYLKPDSLSWYVDSIRFLRNFYGLLVKVSDNNSSISGILRFSITDENTKLVINYNDSLQYNLKVPAICHRINFFKHNYSSSVFSAQLNDTSLDLSKSYVQALSGVQTVIKIKDIDRIKDYSIINKAELIIPVENNMIYSPFSSLSLLTTDKNDSLIILPDDPGYTNFDYFGGSYKNGEYVFKITRYLQSMLREKTFYSNKLIVLPVYYDKSKYTHYNSNVANRVVIDADKIKIRIYYTQISE